MKLFLDLISTQLELYSIQRDAVTPKKGKEKKEKEKI